MEELITRADQVRRKFRGEAVYLRGLIEFTNYCQRNCYYCGLRRDNQGYHGNVAFPVRKAQTAYDHISMFMQYLIDLGSYFTVFDDNTDYSQSFFHHTALSLA
jgi:hypothetical protein